MTKREELPSKVDCLQLVYVAPFIRPNFVVADGARYMRAPSQLAAAGLSSRSSQAAPLPLLLVPQLKAVTPLDSATTTPPSPHPRFCVSSVHLPPPWPPPRQLNPLGPPTAFLYGRHPPLLYFSRSAAAMASPGDPLPPPPSGGVHITVGAYDGAVLGLALTPASTDAAARGRRRRRGRLTSSRWHWRRVGGVLAPPGRPIRTAANARFVCWVCRCLSACVCGLSSPPPPLLRR